MTVQQQKGLAPPPPRARAMLASITGRVYLYSNLLLNTATWATKHALGRLCTGTQHPLKWSAEQDFNIMMLKTLFTCGTYMHWRNFMTIWDKINGKRERQGLLLERVPPETFGVPGCRSSWWISLDPAELAGAPPPTASCVLLYLHGGAFMAGEPRMYCLAFKLWMKQMAAQGISMRVLSVGYPLAPEHPFPAPVKAAAASYRWLMDQLKAEGRNDTVILGGDSAGGNLVVSSLAYLRDGTLDSSSAAAPAPSLPLPAGALLISPAVDFTTSSVFGTTLAAYFEAMQDSHQQQDQHTGKQPAAVKLSALPAVPQPPGAEWDYITVGEGPSVAQVYVRAQSKQDMYQPLVSPTLLPSFKGLVQQKMLVLWGGIEVLAPDCARFAERVQADGVAVQVHVEPNQAHVYCVLPVADALERGAQVVVPYLVSCVRNA